MKKKIEITQDDLFEDRRQALAQARVYINNIKKELEDARKHPQLLKRIDGTKDEMIENIITFLEKETDFFITMLENDGEKDENEQRRSTCESVARRS